MARMRADLARGSAATFVAVALVLLIDAAVNAGRLEGGYLSYAAFALSLAVCGGVLAAAAAAAVLATVHGATRLAGLGWAGAFARAPASDGRAALWIHGAGAGLAVMIAGSAWLLHALVVRFREPGLIALLGATASILVLGGAILVGLAVARAIRGRRLWSGRPHLDPLADPRAALACWMAGAWLALGLMLPRWEQLAQVFPLRTAAALTATALILLEGARLSAVVLAARYRRARRVAAWLLVLAVVGTAHVIDHPEARRTALRSPNLALVMSGIRPVADLDRDGYIHLFGEGDCAPLDGTIHPGAADLPHDGIDQNCSGADYIPGPAPSPFPSRPPPDELLARSVLLITVDTLRSDHTGFAGYPRDTTPNLDALARRGVWFERSYAVSSKTRESLPALATSRFLVELPIHHQRGPEGRFFADVLEPEAVTLAEVLAARGFRTAMFTGYHYFENWQLDQGMEHHVNVGNQLPYRTAPGLTDQALQWLESLDPGERWFLWIHYFEPHDPYEPQPGVPDFGADPVDLYDGEIRFVDQHIGRLTDWLASDGASDTLIVVTSDHGEWLGERGRQGHDDGVWRPLVEVPLLFVVPGGRARRSQTPVSSIDLAPTIAAFVGVEPDAGWTGRALVPELAEDRDTPDRIVFAADETLQELAAITSGWKLIRHGRANVDQLVDVEADPDEQHNAATAHPEVTERLRAALVGWRERVLGHEVETR